MVVMDPKLPSPQSVGREFVRQYYTLLNQAPLHLHRFYSADSSFVHGGLDANEKTSEPVYGQQDIHQRIMQLNFRECKAKIRQVDAHHTIGQGVVVQVSGELSNQGLPMRRFMQTFVLAPQSAKKYYVHNDIFRYQDEVFSEDVQDDSPPPIIDQGVTQIAENALTSPSTVDVETDAGTATNNNVASPKYKGTQPNIGEDGIPSVSINRTTPHVEQVPPANLNAVSPVVRGQEEKEPRVNGGNEHHPEKQIPEPVEEPKQANSGRELKSPELPAPEVVDEVEVSAKSPQPQEVEQPVDESAKAATAIDNPGAPLSYALMAKQNAGNSALTQQANSTSVPGNAAIPVQVGSLPPAGFGKPSTPQQYSGSASQQPKGGEVSKEGTPSPSGPTSFGSSKGGYSRGSGPNSRTGGGGGSGVNRSQGAVLSGSGGGSQSGQGGNRYNRDDDSNRDERRRGQNNTVYPDTQRLFVGNLPHNCSEADLESLFGQYGKVAEIRISSKGAMQSKTLPSGQRVPNFGFVVFENEQSVVECLSHTPIHLPDGRRLNVETKKNKQMRTESTSSVYQQSGPAGGSGSGGGMGGGPAQSKGRGGGASGGSSSAGSGNFGGSQEQLGGGSRPGPWSRPGGQGGRGMPRGGGRGGGYGGGDRSLASGGSGRGGSNAGASSGASSHGSGSGTSNRGAYVGSRRS